MTPTTAPAPSCSSLRVPSAPSSTQVWGRPPRPLPRPPLCPDGPVLAGDFRYTSTMQGEPALRGRHIDRLYLDNTYCHPHRPLPSRQHATRQAAHVIRMHPRHQVVIGECRFTLQCPQHPPFSRGSCPLAPSLVCCSWLPLQVCTAWGRRRCWWTWQWNSAPGLW